MTQYRNIPKSRLLSSVLTAAAFVQIRDLGPAAGALLDDWVDKALVDDLIQHATDPESIDRLIADTRTAHFFSQFAPLFELHAMIDLQDREPARGNVALYKSLKAWGALDAGETLIYGDLEAEIDSHIILTLASRLKAGDLGPESPRGLEFGRLLNRTVPGTDRPTIEALIRKTEDLISLLATRNLTKAREFLQQSELRHRYQLACALLDITGITKQRDALRGLDLYGIILPPGERDAETHLNTLIILEKSLTRFITTYNFTTPDELKDLNTENITGDPAEPCFLFKATKRAVQALANAFPEYRIVSEQGETIPAQKSLSNRPTPPSP